VVCTRPLWCKTGYYGHGKRHCKWRTHVLHWCFFRNDGQMDPR